MPVFKLGLKNGGYMEHPGYSLDDVKTITAPDLNSAKIEYARLTKLDKKHEWDSKRLTYWGLQIVTVQEFYGI